MMVKSKNPHKYVWLYWTSIAILLLTMSIFFVETAVLHSPGYTWRAALNINIPFIIITIFVMIIPLIGGVLALLMAPFWIIFWMFGIAYQGSGGSIVMFIDIVCQGVLSAIADSCHRFLFIKPKQGTKDYTIYFVI